MIQLPVVLASIANGPIIAEWRCDEWNRFPGSAGLEKRGPIGEGDREDWIMEWLYHPGASFTNRDKIDKGMDK